MCTRYPIINRVSELKVHIELTRFVQPEKIEIDANERAVNEKSQYCFFVCTTFDSFLNDLFWTRILKWRLSVYVNCDTLPAWEVIVYRVVASQTRDRGEVVLMDMYEVLSLLFLGGSFLIALLAYIDRNNKRK